RAWFYAPGAALVGPWIYAWVASNRRHLGCSLDNRRQCGVGAGASGGDAGAIREASPGRAGAGVLGALLMGATLAPIAQNWRKQPRDSFPFSYYPMFSEKRGDKYEVNYIVGLDGRGAGHVISYELAGRGGLNSSRRQINKLVRQEQAEQLCRSIADRVARET